MCNLTDAEILEGYKFDIFSKERSMELFLARRAQSIKPDRHIAQPAIKAIIRRATRKLVKAENSNRSWTVHQKVQLYNFINEGRNFRSAAIEFKRSARACAQQYHRISRSRNAGEQS